MNKLIIALAGLLALLAFGNDELDIYIEEPHNIPHELAPIKPVPPIGTERCEQTYVCDRDTQECKWITICK
jgi:hypothetical protein